MSHSQAPGRGAHCVFSGDSIQPTTDIFLYQCVPTDHVFVNSCMAFHLVTILYFILPATTKVRLVKAMVFPVVVCRCESWTIKKAEP